MKGVEPGRRHALLVIVAIALAQGCNALLDNPEGHLVATGGVGGSGGVDASSGGVGASGSGDGSGGADTSSGGVSGSGASGGVGTSGAAGAGASAGKGAGGSSAGTGGFTDPAGGGGVDGEGGAGGTGEGGAPTTGGASGGKGGTTNSGGNASGGKATAGTGGSTGGAAGSGGKANGGSGGSAGAGGAVNTGGPSCASLALTCGPGSNKSCCASAAVPGGTFNRDNNSAYPATISPFRLDLYEVTVGRMRNFAKAYDSGWRPTNGDGANPNNTADSGWVGSSWNSQLPADGTALRTSLTCNSLYQTWTTAPGTATAETRPQNCLTWALAHAFCIWDGGRLPTEAEWIFTAAGGDFQYQYPWGVVGADANHAAYGCLYGGGTGTCTGVTNLAPVGILNAGNGRWGHADLAGNLWEWVRDYQGTYPVPCTDCAILSPPGASYPVMRGGSYESSAVGIETTARTSDYPYRHSTGVRCARQQ